MPPFLPALLALAAFAAPAWAADRSYPVADFDRVIVERAYPLHLLLAPTTRPPRLCRARLGGGPPLSGRRFRPRDRRGGLSRPSRRRPGDHRPRQRHARR